MKVLIHKQGSKKYEIQFVEVTENYNSRNEKIKERLLDSFTGVFDVDFVHQP